MAADSGYRRHVDKPGGSIQRQLKTIAPAEGDQSTATKILAKDQPDPDFDPDRLFDSWHQPPQPIS
jgi:hypothetical protein